MNGNQTRMAANRSRLCRGMACHARCGIAMRNQEYSVAGVGFPVHGELSPRKFAGRSMLRPYEYVAGWAASSRVQLPGAICRAPNETFSHQRAALV